MNIYVAHSRGFDFRKELYEPLRNSRLNQEHELVLPHEVSDELFDSKAYLEDRADVLLAEISFPSTGLGIELAWADSFGVRIVCAHRSFAKPSSAALSLADEVIACDTVDELVSAFQSHLS